jgi:hypothetical protein
LTIHHSLFRAILTPFSFAETQTLKINICATRENRRGCGPRFFVTAIHPFKKIADRTGGRLRYPLRPLAIAALNESTSAGIIPHISVSVEMRGMRGRRAGK